MSILEALVRAIAALEDRDDTAAVAVLTNLRAWVEAQGEDLRIG